MKTEITMFADSGIAMKIHGPNAKYYFVSHKFKMTKKYPTHEKSTMITFEARKSPEQYSRNNNAKNNDVSFETTVDVKDNLLNLTVGYSNNEHNTIKHVKLYNSEENNHEN